MNRYVIYLIFSTLFLTLQAEPALSNCKTSNFDSGLGVLDLVSNATQIALAEVVAPSTPTSPSAAPSTTLDRENELRRVTAGNQNNNQMVIQMPMTTLRVIETLKGQEQAHIYLPASEQEGPFSHSDFNGHADARFWDDADVGRLSRTEDCSVPHQYTVGSRYLVLTGIGAHPKSAELIVLPDDKWLQFVRDSLDGRNQ